MRKFIVEIFIMLLPLIVTVHLLYRPNEPERLRKLEAEKGKLEVINLGSSHGGAFDYGDCPLNGMRFHYRGNTLHYDLQNFRFLNSKGYLAEKAIVVVPVSYFVFGLDENRTDGKSGAFVDPFYGYLPPRYIYDYSLQKDVHLYLYKVQDNFKRMTDKKYREEYMRSEKQGPEPGKKEKLRRLNNMSRLRSKRHLMLSEFSAPEKNMAYLEMLLEEILAAGHKPILITTPYYYAYSEYFSDDFLADEFYARVHKAAGKYHVPYFDYSHDERFIRKPMIFSDSDHLSNEGRKIWSRIFFDDIALEIQQIKRRGEAV